MNTKINLISVIEVISVCPLEATSTCSSSSSNLPSFLPCLSSCPVVSCELSSVFFFVCVMRSLSGQHNDHLFFPQNSEHERRPPGQLLCSNKTQTLHFTLKPVLEKRRQDGSDIYFTGPNIPCLFPARPMVLWEFQDWNIYCVQLFATAAASFDNSEFRSTAEVCSICIF